MGSFRGKLVRNRTSRPPRLVATYVHLHPNAPRGPEEGTAPPIRRDPPPLGQRPTDRPAARPASMPECTVEDPSVGEDAPDHCAHGGGGGCLRGRGRPWPRPQGRPMGGDAQRGASQPGDPHVWHAELHVRMWRPSTVERAVRDGQHAVRGPRGGRDVHGDHGRPTRCRASTHGVAPTACRADGDGAGSFSCRACSRASKRRRATRAS